MRYLHTSVDLVVLRTQLSISRIVWFEFSTVIVTWITNSHFFSANMTNSAKRVCNMNSPGLACVDICMSEGKDPRSRFAPQGNSV